MNTAAFISFIVVILLIVIASWLKRKENKTTAGLFFANKQLGFFSVGCALYFTNISATEFIGGSQSAYINNMSVMAWGVSSVFAMIIVSEFIIPIYLRGQMLTTPDFLEKRFGSSLKKLASILFMLNYFLNILPVVLYGGAVALNGIFHFSNFLHINYFIVICLLVFFTGVIGLVYAIAGGLKAIVALDILFAVGLFICGLLFLYFAFKYIGHENFEQGIKKVFLSNDEHLNSIGSSQDAVPFPTIFTGMLIINLFYWGTEQVIVQQALAGKNLEEIQKGITIACIGKLLNPFLFLIPGVLAVYLLPGIQNSVEVFPRLISLVAPSVFTGVIGAIMFGSIITSFSATLNSFSTLFILNVYKPYRQKKGKDVSEIHAIRKAVHFEMLICIAAICIAPLIYFVKGNFYTYIQKVNAAFSLPILTVMFAGFITKRITLFAAKIGIAFCFCSYVLIQFIRIEVNFLHIIFILFLLSTAIMLIVSKYGRGSDEAIKNISVIAPTTSLRFWQYRYIAYVILLTLMILLFLFFSSKGIAN